jgi:hypothetical protein
MDIEKDYLSSFLCFKPYFTIMPPLRGSEINECTIATNMSPLRGLKSSEIMDLSAKGAICL